MASPTVNVRPVVGSVMPTVSRIRFCCWLRCGSSSLVVPTLSCVRSIRLRLRISENCTADGSLLVAATAGDVSRLSES